MIHTHISVYGYIDEESVRKEGWVHHFRYIHIETTWINPTFLKNLFAMAWNKEKAIECQLGLDAGWKMTCQKMDDEMTTEHLIKSDLISPFTLSPHATSSSLCWSRRDVLLLNLHTLQSKMRFSEISLTFSCFYNFSFTISKTGQLKKRKCIFAHLYDSEIVRTYTKTE